MRRTITALFGLILLASGLSAQTALVRHAPTLNATVEGSVQVMTAENVTLNGSANVTGNLRVPGTPAVQLNGNPTYGGTVEGTGAASPTSHKVTLNGGAKLGHVVRRTDAVALPVVAAPPPPAGTRQVSLNNATESPGDFATLKNLTLNGNVGSITVPPGAYGDFTANSSSRFVLGVAGATTPAVYYFQHLTLNGSSHLDVVGPVVITLANAVSANGSLGNSAHPEWGILNFAAGGLTLNGNVSAYGYVTAPSGTVTVNGNAQLVGGLIADRLTLNGNSLLRLIAPPTANQPPTVALTAPADGATFTGTASFTFAATAADADGTVTKVEFYQGGTKLGEDTTAPYTLPHTVSAPGSYTYTARAIDNLGATTDSAAVTITVTSLNQPPVVALTSPADGTLLTAPASVLLAATASDPDGSIGKVEFYQGATKLGEDFTAPFTFPLTLTSPGTYVFSAKAFDLQSLSTTSTAITVTVVAPNQPPTVALTAPPDGASFPAPASFTLTATAADNDGLVTKVEFFQSLPASGVGAAKIGEDSFSPYESGVAGLAAGNYTYLARATDNTGSATDSAPVTVQVTSLNHPPTVTLTTPADGSSFTFPVTLTLAAVAADSDGTIAKVEFYSGTTKLGEAITPSSPGTFTLTFTLTSAGTYSLTARATDNTGASITSAAITVTVAANGVPYLANFEPAEGYQPGPLDGQNGWAVTGTATVGSALRYAGQQGVTVAPAASAALLVRAFVNIDPSVTFVDLFALPAAATTATGGVFFDTDAARVALTGSSPVGVIQAFQGDGAGGGVWAPTATGPVLDAAGRSADWLRLTTRADYAAKKWDLYFNGRMVAADLGFINNTQPAFTGLGLSGHATLTTGFDDLLVAFDNPLFIDADRDGLDDAWETTHGLNPALNDRNGDLDGDGLTNLQEYLLGTNPNNTDTDGDGLPDGWEKEHNLSPLLGADAALDTDGDGASNLAEFTAGTNPVDYYNGVLPEMVSLTGADGELGPGDVLQLRVTNAGGLPLANAPVTFIAQTGGHQLAATSSGPPAAVVTVRTGTDGVATVYVRGGSN